MLDEVFAWRGQQVRWSRRGSGPPVVLCHGTPWSSALWEPIAEALSADFTVRLWDVLGYGGSTMADGQDVSLGVQGEFLADLLGHRGLGDPHVVAHDYGGGVSLRTCCTGRAMPQALVGAYVSGAAHRPLAPADLEMLVTPWRGEVGQAAFYRQIAQADQRFTDEVEPLHPSIDLPVMVVWGAQDAWILLDRARRLAGMIPGAVLRLVDGARHLVHLDAPERLTAELQRWLSSQT